MAAADEATGKERIAEQLRKDLLNGTWLPEQKLAISALCEHYRCGATPLREALNRMVAEGWVRHLDNRGFVVAPVSVEALQELTETRIWAEQHALRQSIARHTIEWEERLVLNLHRLSRTPRSLSSQFYNENPEWEALHRAFHHSLIENCGSRWLVAFCEELYEHAYRYRQLAVNKVYKERNQQDEHRSIVDAILAGDADLACARLTSHYKVTTGILLEDEKRTQNVLTL